MSLWLCLLNKWHSLLCLTLFSQKHWEWPLDTRKSLKTYKKIIRKNKVKLCHLSNKVLFEKVYFFFPDNTGNDLWKPGKLLKPSKNKSWKSTLFEKWQSLNLCPFSNKVVFHFFYFKVFKRFQGAFPVFWENKVKQNKTFFEVKQRQSDIPSTVRYFMGLGTKHSKKGNTFHFLTIFYGNLFRKKYF